MPPKRPAQQASGITTTNAGDRIIPASVRADGSIRPERRVKQGYTPVEDVAVYKNERAESFRSHQYGHKDYIPPGLAKPTETEDKRKRRRPKKAGEEVESGLEKSSQHVPDGIGQDDPEKKARALRKKIKAATELKERLAKGDKLEDSQIAKIGMLETFQKELAELDLGDIEES